MIDHILTHRTDTHNFWWTYDLKNILYHITKRNDPKPTTGYTHPEQIMYLTGNLKLNIKEVFKLKDEDEIALFKKGHFK